MNNASTSLPELPAHSLSVRGWLGAILLAGLGVRMYLMLTATMVSRDTVIFVDGAKALAVDPLATLHGSDQPPLFPALILLMQNVRRMMFAVSDTPEAWATSAQIVACIGGLACVLVVYALVSWLAGRRAGLWAGLWMAMVPEACQLSADGLSDMPHLALYLLAMTFALRGFLLPCQKSLIAAGLVSGVAYLMRPEGGEVWLGVAIGLAIFPRDWSIRKRVLVGLAGCAGFLLVTGPYIAITGQLVHKKSLWKMVQLEGAGASSAILAWVDAGFLAAGDGGLSVPGAVATILEKTVRAMRVSYVVLFALAMAEVLRPRIKEGAGRLLCGFAVLHGLVLVGLGTGYGYVSMRHTMILVAITLCVAGVVADRVVEVVRVKRPGRWTAVLTSIVMVVLVVGPGIPWMFERLNGHTAHYLEAARYIRDHYAGDAMVVTTRQRIPFYADRPWQPVPDDGDVSDWLFHLHAETRVVAIDAGRVLKRNPDFFEQLQRRAIEPGRIRLLREFAASPESGKGTLRLYDIVHKPQ